MALFGGQRDISLFRTLNRELINELVDTEVDIFKTSIYDVDDNNKPDENVVILRKRPNKNANKVSRPKQYINKQSNYEGRRMVKVANDNDTYKNKTLRNSVKQTISKIRNAKKIKRDQFNNAWKLPFSLRGSLPTEKAPQKSNIVFDRIW